MADELYLNVLTRFPDAREKEIVTTFLAEQNADRTVALSELAWSLLTSAEFRLNH